MYSSLSYVPTTCPVSTDFLIRNARIDNADDIDVVNALSIVATEMVEQYLSRFLITRDIVWTVAHTEHYGLDGMHQLYLMPWPWTTFISRPVVPLPRPTTAVNSVTMGLWGEDPITLVEDTDYEVDTTAVVGRLRWISTTFMNTLKNYVQVDFTSGYGSTSSSVPTAILHAICLLFGRLYEMRGEGTFDVWMPAIEALLAPYRLAYFG